MTEKFQLRTASGDLLAVPEDTTIVITNEDDTFVAHLSLYLSNIALDALTYRERSGRPESGTRSGSSSPTMSSTSSGGIGRPEADVNENLLPSPSANFTSPVNGGLTNASAFINDSMLTSAGEVLRSTKLFRETQSTVKRVGEKACAMTSTLSAERAADSACDCVAASSSSACRTRCSAACTSASSRFFTACASVARAIASLFASRRLSNQAATDPKADSAESPNMAHSLPIDFSSLGVDGVPGPSFACSGASEPSEESPLTCGVRGCGKRGGCCV